MQFTKLFSSILDSTIWRETPEAKIVWVTLLAMSDRNGEIHSSLPGLSDRARVDLSECEKALGRFMAPDKYSRTKEHDGRRVEEIDGGWRLLNHAKYRALLSSEERREYNRRKQIEHRSKESVKVLSNLSNNVKHCQTMSALSAHTESESEAEAESEAERERETRAPAPVSISDGIQKINREESAFVDFLKDLGCLVERDGESIVTEWKAAVKGLKVKRVREMLEQARPGILWPSELRRARVSAGT